MCGFAAQMVEAPSLALGGTGLNPVKALIISGFFSAIAKIADNLQGPFLCLRDQLDYHQRLSVSEHWVSCCISVTTWSLSQLAVDI